MKMRFYCQLAFATARLPCIQIRLPSRERTERDWFQTKLFFVTRHLCLKRVYLVPFLRGQAAVSPLAQTLQDYNDINKTLISQKTRTASPFSTHLAQCSVQLGPTDTCHLDQNVLEMLHRMGEYWDCGSLGRRYDHGSPFFQPPSEHPYTVQTRSVCGRAHASCLGKVSPRGSPRT